MANVARFTYRGGQLRVFLAPRYHRERHVQVSASIPPRKRTMQLRCGRLGEFGYNFDSCFFPERLDVEVRIGSFAQTMKVTDADNERERKQKDQRRPTVPSIFDIENLFNELNSQKASAAAAPPPAQSPWGQKTNTANTGVEQAILDLQVYADELCKPGMCCDGEPSIYCPACNWRI